MEPQQTHLQSLTYLLGIWTPLSSNFKEDLKRYLQLQHVKPKQQLISIGIHLNNAWYSMDCWACAIHILPNGREEVTAIYAPNEIFTDIGSFLQGQLCQHQLDIIHGSMLLKIDRTHFNQLRSHHETATLLEHFLVLQQEKNQWRTDLLVLPDQQKFDQFAKYYPIHQLPGKICASYLRMTPSRYSAAKTQFNRQP
ncbi:Crp/Fnr family transcriptional regulator [Pedobacter helvus]|uniref:Crp/Fnr family transcriptional regulator n=1 Tax=Pedobacter helvus TaxID=2563444 RepID=A0ABW9JNK0_9SPHI|nr:hypothetical protein [Pedobacter ureilyticus]